MRDRERENVCILAHAFGSVCLCVVQQSQHSVLAARPLTTGFLLRSIEAAGGKEVTSDKFEKMRDSEVCSMSRRNQGNKDIIQNRIKSNGFLIREFPVRPLNEGKYVMDYDMPELVVFIYEDQQQQFVKDICIDGADSRKGNMEEVSSNSNGSEFAPQNPCIMDVTKTYGSGDENSIDHTTKKNASEILGEIFKNEDYSRSFSLKHWQINSFLGRIPKSTTLSRPHIENSQSLIDSAKSHPQTDYPEETSYDVGPLCSPTSDSTKSERASDQSIDSKSSTNSFSFPIITTEWKGSPVRMVEADKGQSRKHQRRRETCFPCF